MNRNSTQNIRFLSLLLLIMLIAAMALSFVSCDTTTNEPEEPDNVQNDVEATALGEGSKSFSFEIVFGDGSTKLYTIKTDKGTVGEALVDHGLISGEDGPYGLMVFTVGGELHDYDIDQTYWAFYVNDEYAMSGVDTTEIVEGTKYSFKVGR